MSEQSEVGYAQAMEEVESILRDIEADAVDVDHLVEKVARAAELLELCRGRIKSARVDVTRIVGDLATED